MKFLKLLAAPIVLLFKTLNGAREFIEDRIADVLDKVQSCVELLMRLKRKL